jgi:hypothetical protein
LFYRSDLKEQPINTQLFLIVFLAYLCLMTFIGWFVSRKQKSGEAFLMGGRQLSLGLLLGTVVATLVGTGSSMGAVANAYANGWGGGSFWNWRRSRDNTYRVMFFKHAEAQFHDDDRRDCFLLWSEQGC